MGSQVSGYPHNALSGALYSARPWTMFLRGIGRDEWTVLEWDWKYGQRKGINGTELRRDFPFGLEGFENNLFLHLFLFGRQLCHPPSGRL